MYNIFYEFLISLLGDTVASSVHGQLFCEYGSYVFVVLFIVLLFKITKGILFSWWKV